MDESKIARQYIFSGFEILFYPLLIFVEERLKRRYPRSWQAQVFAEVPNCKEDMMAEKIAWDQSRLLKVIREPKFWRDVFRTALSPYGIEHSSVQALIDVRNKLAHNWDIPCPYAENALGLMLDLAKAIDADKIAAKQLREMRKVLPCASGIDFNGFPFGCVAFDYFQGYNVLHLAMEALRKNDDLIYRIGIDPQRPGRKEDDIRDEGGVIWNVLRFADAGEGKFFENPHLTLGVGSESVSAMATLSNKAWDEYRSVLIGIGEDEFHSMVKKVLKGMISVMSDCPGMEPRLRIRQRRWPTPSARPLVDAYTDVDMRTLDGDSNSESGVRRQPEWVGAVFDVLKNKNSNLELQIGASFPYRTCQKIAGPNALNFVAQAWIACKPYIDVLFERKNAPVSPRPRGGTPSRPLIIPPAWRPQ